MPSMMREDTRLPSDCELRLADIFITVLILTAAQSPAEVRVPAAIQGDLNDDSEM